MLVLRREVRRQRAQHKPGDASFPPLVEDIVSLAAEEVEEEEEVLLDALPLFWNG